MGGAGHGHPKDGGKEFFCNRVGFHPVSPADTASLELKRRTKEIKRLAPNRCPVPFRYLFLGSWQLAGGSGQS